MEILKVEDLTFKYPEGRTKVLDGINFSVNEGEFVLVSGATGSGKSTLLRLLKKELTPKGEAMGKIRCLENERVLSADTDEDEVSVDSIRVGFVMQNPKEQTVTDKVWHELAFGLENMNTDREKMSARIAEMAGYFGIEDWFDRNVNELSGGQLQLLNLASVMVTDPKILILDEPTAQLDPLSSDSFFTALKKLNRDFALTVIIAEHRLEELVPVCDRMMVLKSGKINAFDEPAKVLEKLKKEDEIFDALPCAYRLYGLLKDRELNLREKPPITIREGREVIRKIKEKNISPEKEDNTRKYNIPAKKKGAVAAEFKNVFFRFDKNGEDVLNNLSFKVYEGEAFCILGGNGSGKTTALNALAGLIKPYAGSIRLFDKKLKEYKNGSLYNKCLSMLSQDVQTVFLHNTVREELDSMGGAEKLKDLPFDLSSVMDKHPYDLSGGEQQIAAFAKTLLTEPKILLADEPTKGLDAYRKKIFAGMIASLKEKGLTIIIVTHDVEFAAECADRCMLLFKGSCAACSDRETFFESNSFYTTGACRMSKGICRSAATVEELARSLKP